MSVDYLKLFHARRLSIKEPEHLTYIKGHLAAMKIEDPSSYAVFSAFYGVDVDVEVIKEPSDPQTPVAPTVGAVEPPAASKKRGRPPKPSSPTPDENVPK